MLLVLSTSQFWMLTGSPLKEIAALASTPTCEESKPVPSVAAPGTRVARLAKFRAFKLSWLTCEPVTTSEMAPVSVST